MLTASKDCNLDWKVQYTQYFNISKDDIDVLFRLDTVPYDVCMYYNQVLKYIAIKISSLEFM